MVSIDQQTKINQRRLGKAKPVKLKKPPKWHPPSSQEREYMRVLFSLTNELKTKIKEIREGSAGIIISLILVFNSLVKEKSTLIYSRS